MKGITLVELVVVMAIVAILLTFAGPPMSAGLDNILLQSTGQRALAAFRLAQNTARSSGQRVLALQNGENLNFVREDKIYQTLELPSGIRMNAEDRIFVFLESGRIIGPDALELTNARGRQVRLLVDRAHGTVKLAKQDQTN